MCFGPWSAPEGVLGLCRVNGELPGVSALKGAKFNTPGRLKPCYYFSYTFHAMPSGEQDTKTQLAKQEATEPSTPSPQPSPDTASPVSLSTSGAMPQMEFVTPLSESSQPSDEAPRRYRMLSNINGTCELVENFEYSEPCLLANGDLVNFTEAETHECWRRAMIDEVNSIVANKTWNLTYLPQGHRAIGLKWVYKIKKGP
uniref:Reverse transcriptase Ty1/copia-type domain-containing protein n=1 Tax=Oryza brachyantha TaxID=4533 RepID=J3L0V6_ORYBR